MPDLATRAQPTVRRLLSEPKDETEPPVDLYLELGKRLRAIETNPAVAGSFDPRIPDLEGLGPVDDLRAFGEKFFPKVSRSSYALVCGKGSADAADRQRVIDAFRIGSDAVGAAIAALLVSSLGLAPAIAVVVGALIVKLFLENAYTAGCELWEQKLGS